MTPQEKAKDKRLQKTYGITLEQWNRLFELQGGKCAICGKPLAANANVDHFHFTITATRCNPKDPKDRYLRWFAVTEFHGLRVVRNGGTKEEAVRLVRAEALPLSVRGLLCPGRYVGCNRLLGKVDKIEWITRVLEYLKNPPAKQIIS